MRTAAMRGALLLAGSLAACSRSSEGGPTWIRLATLEGSRLTPSHGARLSSPSKRELSIETSATGSHVAFEFRKSDWKQGERCNYADLPAWTLPVRSRSTRAPLTSLDEHQRAAPAFEGDAPYRLHDERGDYELWFAREWKKEPVLPPRSFTILRHRLYMNPGPDGPPAKLTLDAREQRDSVEEGCRRFLGDRYSGEGLVVWPGETLELSLDLPPRSALHFGLALEPRVHFAFVGDVARTFRVAVDGKTISEERIAADKPELRWCSAPLPPAGGRARLSFSVEGAHAQTVFVEPVIAPLESGAPGARPWEGARPDLVVFLADTFRADNLAAYGGRPELAPCLNELASRSRLFARAWSTATYTLAAHASLFTGRWPRQAGILDVSGSVSRELLTVAEFLARLGYRTGAVTDRGYVSQNFGMDQGFQSFDAHEGTLDETAERVHAFLEADDGRPMFLFVHTYRTHQVYEVSPETRAELGIEARESAELRALEREYGDLSEGKKGAARDEQRISEIARALEPQYRGTVRDLDRGFQRILGELEARGTFRNGYLLFTSDHGESFAEHGAIFHKGEVHEEQVRVPLFLHGTGISGERVEWPSSLVDVPATLARLAGAEPSPDWLGTSLLELSGDRALYAFQCDRKCRTGSTLCVIEGGRKVIAGESSSELRTEGLREAYDLGKDPRELSRVAGEKWPAELLERHRHALDAALQPRFAPASAGPAAEDLQDLEAMGYGGDDDGDDDGEDD